MGKSSDAGHSVCTIFACLYSIRRAALLLWGRGYHWCVKSSCQKPELLPVCGTVVVQRNKRHFLVFFLLSMKLHLTLEYSELIDDVSRPARACRLTGTIYYGDLRRFDPLHQTWTYLSGTVQGTPSARELHSFTSDSTKLYVFGGSSSNSSENYPPSAYRFVENSTAYLMLIRVQACLTTFISLTLQ